MAVVRRYAEPADIEVAGLVAAALALGSAPLIVRAVERVLAPLGPYPAAALASMDDGAIAAAVGGFRYRFFDENDVGSFLCAIRSTRERHGSLERAFLSGDRPGDADYASALSLFVRKLATHAPASWRPNLFPDPARGSAAKRSFLYLRWMIRRDAVDPGPWRGADPRRLVVPLDTHMAAACRRLGLLTRGITDLKAAREALAALRVLSPEDPVRYD
ncbi:MAG: TIGR02757 family protein, partial [Spirochaetales bacterium]|nr:TIGR02757 family protein [Spirochaetales bacterium]